MDEYTEGPIVAIRIFDEGDGWAMDGVDGKGGYTQEVWSYDTEAETEENRDAFIRHLRREGYTVIVDDEPSRWESAGKLPGGQPMEYRNTL